MLNNFTFLYLEVLSNLPLISQNLNFKQGIYMFFFLDKNGVLHSYIGSAVDLGARIRRHVSNAKSGVLKYHVYNSMRLYGINSFKVGILSFLPDVSLETLHAVERDLIIKHGPSLNMS